MYAVADWMARKAHFTRNTRPNQFSPYLRMHGERLLALLFETDSWTWLLKFLHVCPCVDARRFDADVTRLWKVRQAEEAVNRLKKLSRCLVLRRPKTAINLPPRTDLRYPVDFLLTRGIL